MSNRIKILSPIDRVEEVLPLIKAGVDEFYCGVLIDNITMATKRTTNLENSNLLNLTEFKKLVAIIKKQNKNIFLVLNEPGDNIESFSVIEKNISKIKKIALDAVIVSNINLMDRLKNDELDVIASSLLEVKNKETVRFLVEAFGVKRIILDRQITISDLDSIVFEFPQIELETFIWASGCRSLNSACNRYLVAKNNKLGVHFCINSFDVDRRNKNHYLDLEDKKIIAGRLKMPLPTCGACALYHFNKYSISSVKIVGRGYPTEVKIESVRFIRKALDVLSKNYSEKKYYQAIENLFTDRFKRRCNRQLCYYSHFMH